MGFLRHGGKTGKGKGQVISRVRPVILKEAQQRQDTGITAVQFVNCDFIQETEISSEKTIEKVQENGS